VDLKSDCVQYAKQACAEYHNIKVVQTDYRDVVKQSSHYDIIITSLFCHHLSNEEITELLQWCRQYANVATLVNDLHRHALAYYSIKVLTKLFSKSYLVKNDAPLSVLRGFSRSDLQRITLNDTLTKIYWSWAFRWVIIQFNKNHVNT
jgi:cyclopropane fatty-acyl-phospholipid synthase-like methyltransferase